RSSPSASAAVSERRCTSSAASSSSSWKGMAWPSGLREGAEGSTQQRTQVGRAVGLVGDGVDRLLGVLGVVAQAHEPLVHLVAPGGGRGRRRTGGAAAGRTHAVLELEDDPLRALLADPGDLGEGLDVVG